MKLDVRGQGLVRLMSYFRLLGCAMLAPKKYNKVKLEQSHVLVTCLTRN